MKVWFVDQASTDGYQCTEGPFVSKEYVMFSDKWTFSELAWGKVIQFDEDNPKYYAEETIDNIISGFVLYEVEVQGS